MFLDIEFHPKFPDSYVTDGGLYERVVKVMLILNECLLIRTIGNILMKTLAFLAMLMVCFIGCGP